MAKWVDTKIGGTPHEGGGEVVISRMNAGRLLVYVERVKGFPGWFMSCGDLFKLCPLASHSLNEAKCQAAAMIQVELEDGIKAILA